MNWLRRFMYGRYGNDQLNTFLLVLYFVLAVLNIIFNTIYLWIASLIPICWLFFRMLSKNYGRRRAENAAFLRLWRLVSGYFKTNRARMKDNMHRYYRCPSCRATLRVPKNVGKIEITCPVCGAKLTRKT